MTVEGVLGPIKAASSRMSPVEVHIAHLRHLGKLRTAEMVLTGRHRISRTQARVTARMIGPYVNQAIQFHAAARGAQPQVRPVLQYYCYLNLAAAAILTYRPGSSEYRRHGISDLTHSLKVLDLSSKVAEFRKGAIPEFHNVLCGQELTGAVRLKDLVVAIPMLAVELEEAFDTKKSSIVVTGSVEARSAESKEWVSKIQFTDRAEPGGRPARVPVGAIERVVPMLQRDYRRVGKAGHVVRYASRKSWAESSRSDAEEFHRSKLLLATNLGGRFVTGRIGASVGYLWRYSPRVPLYPTVSAGLILSFVLASLCRYRPVLVDQLEGSRVNLLVDVFASEADGFMIPAFRNLLYREELLISAMEFV
jgi:hypothetical protein